MVFELPPVFIIPFKIPLEELHVLEREITSNVYNIHEAKLVLGRISQKKRAEHELKVRGLFTEDVTDKEIRVKSTEKSSIARSLNGSPYGGDTPVILHEGSRKSLKRKQSQLGRDRDETDIICIDDSTESENDERQLDDTIEAAEKTTSSTFLDRNLTIVVRLDWYLDSRTAGVLVPLENYIIYAGRKVTDTASNIFRQKVRNIPSLSSILTRAAGDPPSKYQKSSHQGRHAYHHPALLTETTSEHDISSHLPPIPSYLHTNYSCRRPTPLDPPNAEFIKLLSRIHHFRILASDSISVRAYSSAISILASYPYTLTSFTEVLALPGCGEKIALLYNEFRTTGSLQELAELEADEALAVKDLFFNIYGVGAITAREWYHRGWRTLDDAILRWDELSREQQVGLKFYDEFQLRIPRLEVEAIAEIILQHANAIAPGFQMVIVGGYRRGKPTSGDVDVVLSHRDESRTLDLITPLVHALEDSGYVTHALKITTRNSQRAQESVAWKGEARAPGHGGFDTLDSAFLAWQNPVKPADGHAAADTHPNPHRRVDIIITPWKTAGCAVLGWSGGTTFQRDLRLWCKKECGLKFDSSGIRERQTGAWIDVERRPGLVRANQKSPKRPRVVDLDDPSGEMVVNEGEGPGEDDADMLEKEKRVFKYLGLDYLEPGQRCTG